MTPYKIAAAVMALAAALLLGGWAGWDWRGARCDSARAKDIEAHNAALASALTDYAQQARAEQARAVLAAVQRQTTSATAQEVTREAATNPDDRACEWSDAQRLRLERLYETFGHARR